MRKLLLFFSIVFIGVIFLGRLSYLQLFDNSFEALSNKNAIKIIYDYPERGYIYDRDGKLLVSNQPAYDVMVIPRDLKAFDTLEFCSLLKITREKFDKELARAKRYSPRLPSVIVAQLSKNDYAFLQEKMRKYPGFYIQKRSLRDYQTNIGANVLGYIAEVNPDNIKNDSYYQSGELLGKTGIEKSYEDLLRGIKGKKYIQKDRFNRDIGPYKEGVFDTLPEKGKDITVTIDAELQAYGELLMQNKRGGVVAIEPETGEILTMVSAPNYNPDLLVGRPRSANYMKLAKDTIAKPLYDRGLLAEYSPGSPFKILNALAALQEEVITPETKFTCYGGYTYARNTKPLGCHCYPGARNDMNRGIYESCNAYFGQTYRKIIEKFDDHKEGIDNWADHIKSFGLGNYLGYDLSTGRKGLVPDSKFYDKWYPNGGWRGVTTISNSIGQGEVLATPIQLANMTAAVANRGYYYTPHIIKKINDEPINIKKYTTPRRTTIDAKHFEPVVQGMYDVYRRPGGTAYYSQVKGIDIAGKTGTVENFMIIDSVKTQLDDHSVFIAFAPKDKPKIALAVFIENGYWGGRWAAPIASLMIEKYIRNEITRTDLEYRMLNGSLEEVYAKPYSGKPFRINE
ncbi:penicillin-binding protein 2 [Spongiivirga citrea]|uniref:Penicillin-binding protein 2 n=1 Tax=Spongiivirga citrea TaxID=1481457 RepID=A0A6M0CQZ0_9FLAO|nr:penicillin-binding protein 2 [Spongiivirga citrea]NER18269.1 penicillin-binding protein 2 [Spongiivirga citrea]